MRGTDVQEGRKLARLETISAVIYDALLVFQLCISRRGNELAAMRYTCTPPMDIGWGFTNFFSLLSFNYLLRWLELCVECLKLAQGKGGEGKSLYRSILSTLLSSIID